MTDVPAADDSAARRGRPPRDQAPEPRARPDLALLARSLVDLRGPQRDHGRPARIHGPRQQGRSRSGPVPGLDQRRDHRDHRPADHRLDLRLHDLALGTPQAVHLHRLGPRRGLPRRDRLEQHAHRDRRVHHPPAVQLELRAGPVPGLHPGSRPGGAGRCRKRARRVDAGAGRRVGLHHRRACDRHPQLRRSVSSRSASSNSSRCCWSSSGSAKAPSRNRAKAGRGGRSPPRPGGSTSSRSTASCGWSPHGSRS